MGYHVSGSVRLSFSDTILTLIELRMKELSAVANSEPFGETTIDKVLNFLWFTSDDKFFRDDDGVTTVLCWPEDKWFPFNDEILRLLGECGVGIVGAFTGEDDHMWGYDTVLNSHVYREYARVPAPEEYVDAVNDFVGYVKRVGLPDGLPEEFTDLVDEIVRSYVDESVLAGEVEVSEL